MASSNTSLTPEKNYIIVKRVKYKQLNFTVFIKAKDFFAYSIIIILNFINPRSLLDLILKY